MTKPNTSLIQFQSIGPIDSMMGQVGQLSSALMVSEKTVAADNQKTGAQFDHFMAAMQAKISGLFAQINQLQEQLVVAESRERETKIVHAQELAAVQGEKEAAKQEVLALRKEMVEEREKAKASIAVEFAARTEAVRAAIQAGEVRVAQAQQETAAARKEMEAARQEAAQRLAAARAEGEAAVQAAKKADALLLRAAQEESRVAHQHATKQQARGDDLEGRIARFKGNVVVWSNDDLRNTIGTCVSQKIYRTLPPPVGGELYWWYTRKIKILFLKEGADLP